MLIVVLIVVLLLVCWFIVLLDVNVCVVWDFGVSEVLLFVLLLCVCFGEWLEYSLLLVVLIGVLGLGWFGF